MLNAKSEIGRKISNFNTADTFKFRRISDNSDLTIYVKEIGIKSFHSDLNLWCFNKYGKCEAKSDAHGTSLAVFPDITAPYLSFYLLPSWTINRRFPQPAVIGTYACQISEHISASGEIKYLLGKCFPIISLKLSSKFSYFGMDFRTDLNDTLSDLTDDEEDEIDQDTKPFFYAKFSGDVYVTDEVNKANLSLDLETDTRTVIGLHLSNRNTYLSFNVSNMLDFAAYSFGEFEYKNVKYGIRASLKKDDEKEELLKKKVSVGFRMPIQNGYFGMALKNPTVLSSKLKLNVNKKCQISTTLRFSNFMLSNPHLGMSICVSPDDVQEIGTKELHQVCRPRLSLF